MKKLITIGFMILLSVSLLQAQERQLVLTNKSNQRERVIEPGKKIRVYKSEYHKVKGQLSIVDTTSIAVGNDTMPLDSIFKIETITKDSRPSGVLLTTVGALILVGGFVALDEINSSSGSSSGISGFGPSENAATGGVGIFMIIGAVITGAGIDKLVSGANYKSKKWNYSIRSIKDVDK